MTTKTVGAGTAVRRPRAQWPVPAGLILLSLVPLIHGSPRLGELTSGAPVTPENARFFDSPLPVLIHIPSVTVYCLLGAFQFLPSLRGRRGWHRIAGRILVPAGLLAALTGLWMAAFYDLPPFDGQLMLILRLVFGSAMVASIVLGLVAVRRRDFLRHGAWMARGYAIGLRGNHGSGVRRLDPAGRPGRRAGPGAAHGGGMGDQPGGGRVLHPRPGFRAGLRCRRPVRSGPAGAQR